MGSIPTKPMIWFSKRLSDDRMTLFRPGDLIVPRGTVYNEDPAIFLGLSWEYCPRKHFNSMTSVKFVEVGWEVHPWVYKCRWGIRGMDWHYIQNCELLQRNGELTKSSKHWEEHGFKFFVLAPPVPKQSIMRRMKAFLKA